MWQVRAGSLNELIYKQGQAGVTKASVTLVFDNTDPAMSPHGYEQYQQLTVTRQVRTMPAPQTALRPRPAFCRGLTAVGGLLA